MSQANQSMRGDLSDTQNSIGLRHSVSIATIVQNTTKIKDLKILKHCTNCMKHVVLEVHLMESF